MDMHMDIDEHENEDDDSSGEDDDINLNDIVVPAVEEELLVEEKATLVENQVGGKSHKICDILRLKRFLVMGAEEIPVYDTTKNPKKSLVNNIFCLQRLLKNGRHEVVLDILVDYAKEGRCIKDVPLLTVLALCAEHKFPETNFEQIQKAAYRRLPEICTIPTKLFQFVNLTNNEIKERRKEELDREDPPPPQKWRGRKGKRKPSQSDYSEVSRRPVLKPVYSDGRKSAGWGRMRRKSVAKFYEDDRKDACRLTYLSTKYRRRSSYTQAHLIKYAHPHFDENDEKSWVLSYLSHGIKYVRGRKENLKNPVSENISEVINFIEVIDEVRGLRPARGGDLEKLLEILQNYGKRRRVKAAVTCTTMDGDTPLPHVEWQNSSIHIIREHIPNGFLNSKEVWGALFMDMPMTAMIRNIGKMASTDLFNDQVILEQLVMLLEDEHKLRAAKIHPLKILIAKICYEMGCGERGHLAWEVKEPIVAALDAAFRKSFISAGTCRTGKRLMLCLNVSAAMTKSKGCSGCKSLSPAMASCALALVAWNLEEHVELVAFGGGGNVIDLKEHGFDKGMSLQDALHKIEKIELGSTDCGLPMIYAVEKNLEIDAFIIYTDSQPHFFGSNPSTELQNYNNQQDRNAKLIVCGMASSGFTIADPDDPNMLDVVGFNMHVPELIREFVLGHLSGQCLSAECYECEARRQP